MAVNYQKKIVTDGLVLCLDAGDVKSYPGSGTVWYDRSGNSNSGILTGGVGYSDGTMVFDGINDFVDCGNLPTLQITQGTICAWIKATKNDTSIFRAIICKQWAWGMFVQNNILVSYDWGSYTPRSTGTTVGNSQWYNVVMSFTETIGTPSNNALIYVNGGLVLTTTIKHSNHNVGCFIGFGNASQQYMLGSISNVQIYNKPLSQQEILQNYNAQKGRFGL